MIRGLVHTHFPLYTFPGRNIWVKTHGLLLRRPHVSVPPPTVRPPGNPHLQRITYFHAPSKVELLSAATSLYQRLKIRFKFATIRQYRAFTADEISAFFTWILAGHVLWIVVGTTTFVSLAIAAINTVSAQVPEFLARSVGNYLTRQSGITVIFESAIVPKSGKIQLNKVFASKRLNRIRGRSYGTMKKGSPMAAATAAATLVRTEVDYQDWDFEAEAEDVNCTQFDLTIDTVDVTLSFMNWWNGKGLLHDVEIKGVRGVVDRTHVSWTGEEQSKFPKELLRVHREGDFEIQSFRLEDLLVTVLQPNSFRPFQISIFSCELPRLRKQWMFYDFLCANSMSGSYDGSLFTLHPRQSQSTSLTSTRQTSRFRIDDVKIDHLNRDISGPFGWIRSGTADFTADMIFPPNPGKATLINILQDIIENIERNTQLGFTQLPTSTEEKDPVLVVFDLRVQLNNVKAAVPYLTSDLSYTNNALVRPIVAFINSQRTFIPLNCHVVKPLSEFDGAWGVCDCGLLRDVSDKVYEAFVRNVRDDQVRRRRLQKVGMWSLRLLGLQLMMAMNRTSFAGH
ncbi:Mitochondrial distribution and morphology protein 31 [Neolecta irregularis DAH-3]|uniref:Mitochondrial distribution and morphology protein 31 n=1 Tax=Neolecta irregularis (strain DAH-3) TaxID=1198029 RepID=A0A1U7LT08_NEOID|nr:Mitochondrial distribution and morphology protein 31 [Neolecta irregularis DAH-3]|eukprot:OLL25784.1 Mitochondrial distribution and morphology protein 31 [Neolecta irregularis DAH-3]